ncbi:MAG: glycosyltransferase [Planctomycetota bacterium]
MISVLTVNYRCADQLAQLLESLQTHSAGLDVELVVTNNSPDDPVRLAGGGDVSVTVFESTNVGFAAGINRAYRASRGNIVMIANPDVRVLDGTLQRAVERLHADPNIGVVLPLLRYPDGRVQQSARRFYTWPVVLYARSPLRMLRYRPAFFRRYLCEDLDRSAPVPVDWGLGAAMFLRRSDCDAGHILDERFFLYFEDVDLCYGMWQRGRSVMYCPDIECIHEHRRFSRNPFSQAGWRHLQSLLRFVGKHGGLRGRPDVHSTPQA